MHTYLDRKTLERSDFADCCLFTGVVPVTQGRLLSVRSAFYCPPPMFRIQSIRT